MHLSMEPLACFAISPVLTKHSLRSKSQIVRQRFVSGGLHGGIGLRHAKLTPICKASGSEKDQSDDYKAFAELLGPPNGKFSERDQVRNISGLEQEDAAEIAAKKASDYEEMSDLLGPPTGRFQRKFDDTRRRENKHASSVESKDKTSEFVSEANSTASMEYSTSSEIIGAPGRKLSESEQVKGLRPIEKEDEIEATIKRAKEYAEMAEILGPPKGRFRHKDVKAGAQEATTSQVEERVENQHSMGNASAAASEGQKPPKVKKEAVTKEEEYKLFESLLRGGKGTKPRKGGKRFVTRETLIDGFVTDPWNNNFNLMPKKTVGNAKGSPPKKGQAPLKMPDKVFITTEGVEQSYWALEQVLEDEEEEYQAAKAREEQAAEEKREQKRKAKLLRKPAHRNDVISRDVKPKPEGEDALSNEGAALTSTVPQPQEQPASVLQAPPRRPSETDASVSTQSVTSPEKSPVELRTSEKPRSILGAPPQRPAKEDSSPLEVEEVQNKPRSRQSRKYVLELKSPKILYNLDEDRMEQ